MTHSVLKEKIVNKIDALKMKIILLESIVEEVDFSDVCSEDEDVLNLLLAFAE
jgi:hypothetical protein|tara:strand:+ start:2322 stop:2480 length:159 start_codon:yes stop_codon:yes gene_type:complete